MKSLFISILLIIGLKLSAQIPTMNTVDDALEISQKNSSRTFSAGDQWQSFAPNTTGMFSIFRAYHYNELESGTLYVYEGEGTSGKLLHQQAYTANGTHFLFFRLSSPIPVVSGKTYTVRLSKFNWFVSVGNAYLQGKSSKNPGRDMMFEVYLTKPQQVLINGKASQATISHGQLNIPEGTNEKYVNYTVNNMPDIQLGTDGNTEINLRLEPVVFIRDGLLYAFFSTGDSTITIDEYTDEWNEQKNYIYQVNTSISVDDQSVGNNTPIRFELWRDGPTNLNEEGIYTDMQSFTLGINGTNPGASYTVGTTSSQVVRDFNFVNSQFDDQAKFNWTLSKTSMESMVQKEAGQIATLTAPPTIATESFPVYCQALFKSKVQNATLPDFINVRLHADVMLSGSSLKLNQNSPIEAFFNGLGFLVNPKTYSGELLYRIVYDPIYYINYVDIRLDLRPFKN